MRSRFFAPDIASLMGAILHCSFRSLVSKDPSPGVASACRKGIRQPIVGLVAMLVMACSLPAGAQQDEPGYEPTPPALSLVEGSVSFWRPGAEDWAPARLNTPLAPGDAIYTDARSNLEIQIGARAFVRADERTQLSLANQGEHFLQFRVTSGRVSFDLRTLPAGYTIELDTPNSVFTMDRAGYYRVEVDEEATHLVIRRGGRASVTLASGEVRSILSSEEIVVSGADASIVETYVAPDLDSWDRWNYARTEHDAEAMSNRYLPSGVYGAESLDNYGSWRVLPTYGSVWVPDGISPDWAPYSTGSWIWDLRFGWTWVDEAPWGWAPYHYGRWIFVDGFWAWAPGPVVVRPVYAPALVAFFRFGHAVSAGVSIGAPGVCWVALGWGEPLIPWWGRQGFVGKPWWGGWGGPRIVNNVVISRTTVINVNKISFHNMKVRNALVAVPSGRFGRGGVHGARISGTPAGLAPIRGVHPVKPVPASLVAGGGVAVRPPRAVFSRSVVEIRPSRGARQSLGAKPAITPPEPRVISSPKRQPPQAVLPRPPFGQEIGSERQRPAPPPRFGEMRSGGVAPGEVRERGASPRAEPPASRSAPSVAVPPLPQTAPPNLERERREFQDQGRGVVSPPAQREVQPGERVQPRVEREQREFRDQRREGAGQQVQRESQPRESVPPRMEIPQVRPAPPMVAPSPPRIVTPRVEREQREPRETRRGEVDQSVQREERRRQDERSRGQPRSESKELPGRPANRMFPMRAP